MDVNFQLIEVPLEYMENRKWDCFDGVLMSNACYEKTNFFTIRIQ